MKTVLLIQDGFFIDEMEAKAQIEEIFFRRLKTDGNRLIFPQLFGRFL